MRHKINLTLSLHHRVIQQNVKTRELIWKSNQIIIASAWQPNLLHIGNTHTVTKTNSHQQVTKIKHTYTYKTNASLIHIMQDYNSHNSCDTPRCTIKSRQMMILLCLAIILKFIMNKPEQTLHCFSGCWVFFKFRCLQQRIGWIL